MNNFNWEDHRQMSYAWATNPISCTFYDRHFAIVFVTVCMHACMRACIVNWIEEGWTGAIFKFHFFAFFLSSFFSFVLSILLSSVRIAITLSQTSSCSQRNSHVSFNFFDKSLKFRFQFHLRNGWFTGQTKNK